MDICESNQLTVEQEFRHWWIRARFAYLERAIKLSLMPPTPPRSTLRVLEVGCGTGQNLRYLKTESPRRHLLQSVTGVEPALSHEKRGLPWLEPLDQVVGSVNELDPMVKYDLLMAMDVLEHIDDDLEALKEWLRYLKPGGVAFITVPAFKSLWSYHDDLLQHRRRYTAIQLRHIAEQADLELIGINYAFAPIFIPAFLIRKLSNKLGKKKMTTDLFLPHPVINRSLLAISLLEEALGGNSFFGTSTVGYFRKRIESKGAHY